MQYLKSVIWGLMVLAVSLSIRSCSDKAEHLIDNNGLDDEFVRKDDKSFWSDTLRPPYTPYIYLNMSDSLYDVKIAHDYSE